MSPAMGCGRVAPDEPVKPVPGAQLLSDGAKHGQWCQVTKPNLHSFDGSYVVLDGKPLERLSKGERDGTKKKKQKQDLIEPAEPPTEPP